MQGWIVTAAPSVLDEAVRHFELEAYGVMSFPVGEEPPALVVVVFLVEVVVVLTVVVGLEVVVGLVLVLVGFLVEVVEVGLEEEVERGGTPVWQVMEPPQPSPGSGVLSQVQED